METRLPQDPSYQCVFRGRAVMGNVSYWLASDHLLMVQTTMAQENYRRFELRDLELVVVRPNSVRKIAGWVVGVLFALLAILAAVVTFRAVSAPESDNTAVAIVAAVPTLILGAVFAWIVIPGRFCQVRIRTGVQTLDAPGIVRLPKARRFVGALRAASQALHVPDEAAPPSP